MESTADMQPISLLEVRALRQVKARNTEALTPAQRRAYRQLAIYALGIDVGSLTTNLRARRLQREVEIVPMSDHAA